jgi:hypothetical protein
MLVPAQGGLSRRIASTSLALRFVPTRMWMLDVRSHLERSIDASDESLRQCPPAELCPKDCTISQLDFLQNVSISLHNKYDVVHVRLIMGGLKDDPSFVINNLMAMLSIQ